MWLKGSVLLFYVNCKEYNFKRKKNTCVNVNNNFSSCSSCHEISRNAAPGLLCQVGRLQVSFYRWACLCILSWQNGTYFVFGTPNIRAFILTEYYSESSLKEDRNLMAMGAVKPILAQSSCDHTIILVTDNEMVNVDVRTSYKKQHIIMLDYVMLS